MDALYDHPDHGVMTLEEVWTTDAGVKYGRFKTVKWGTSINMPLCMVHRLP